MENILACDILLCPWNNKEKCRKKEEYDQCLKVAPYLLIPIVRKKNKRFRN